MKDRNQPLHPLLGAYIAHLSGERRLSLLTCEAYAHDIRVLFQLAEKNDTPLEKIQIHQIRRFIAQLHGAGRSGRSLARMLSAWRGFYDYLARQHGGTQNPCAGLRPPKSPKTLPHALSPDEASRLLAFAPDTRQAICDLAMFELLYSSGLRRAELISLKPEDVNFAEGTVRVTGKGSKTREVPVGSRALAAISVWRTVRDKVATAGASSLFLSRSGKNLSTSNLQSRLKMRAAQQGISSNVHPHVLRHSFASHLLQSSGDLRAVQEMLGHASISSTQVYTHLDFQHLAKVYDAAHPRARKK